MKMLYYTAENEKKILLQELKDTRRWKVMKRYTLQKDMMKLGKLLQRSSDISDEIVKQIEYLEIQSKYRN